MTIKQALSHFEYKLSNHWKPTAKDIEAYNEIVEFTESSLKNQYNDNQLFAKLYIYIYGEFLKYYEGTVMDNIPQKELHRILDKPIEQLINEFIDKHQIIELALQVPKEIRYLHPLETRYKELQKDFNFEDVEKLPYNETEDNLTSLINMALTKYNKQ